MAKKRFPINRMGVYKITNLINGKIYIGSSFDMGKRWNRHLNELKSNKHHSQKLQRAFNKYGVNNFIFEELELCGKENLNEVEQFWLDKFDSYNQGYNCSPNVKKPMLGKNHSNETKKIMSSKRLGKILSEETREKLSLSNKGKKYDIYTEERNNKISESLKGRQSPILGKKRSQQFKEKHYKKIKQFTKDGVYIKTWDSISECANHLSMDSSSITKVCRGKLKSSNNFKFSYV